MKIMALVVTYNRKELLKENIDSLKKQDYKDFDIFVINNKSTDDTENMLIQYKEKINNFNFVTLEKNFGGAGGFSYGVKQAILKKYDFVWLMDDDTIPKEDSLSSLVSKANVLNEDFSFLSSVVKWTDGNWCYSNKPVTKELWGDKFDLINKNGLIELERASFVSCFINLKKCSKLGLPIKEFFIYEDDVEYTKRLSKYKPAYLDLNSVVIHKMKNNYSKDRFSLTDKEKIKRIKFMYRNYFYICKKEGIKSIFKGILRYFYHCIRFLVESPKYKLYKIWCMTKGMILGIFFNPKIEYVEEVKDEI